MPAEINNPRSASADGAMRESAVQDGRVREGAAQEGAVRRSATADRSVRDGAVRDSAVRDHPAHDASTTHNPIQIDADTCVKCDLCDWICPGDLIYKKPDDRETLPEVRYPDECWYCGLCQSICPVDAITIIFPKQMIRCRTDVTTLLGKVIE